MDGLKTSVEWNYIYNFNITEPIGWDKENFNFSWFEESITEDEFLKRVSKSTFFEFNFVTKEKE